MGDGKVSVPGIDGNRRSRCLLFDWGGTVMRVFPEFEGPMSTWPRVELVDGLDEALAILRPDWTIALATNAADSQEREIWSALSRTGVEQLIDRVYCYRGVGHRKSEPEYFESVLADLGIEAKDAVMVGDDFEADVASANRAGIRAVWFHENAAERTTGSSHRTIFDLHELPEALGLLVG